METDTVENLTAQLLAARQAGACAKRARGPPALAARLHLGGEVAAFLRQAKKGAGGERARRPGAPPARR